MVQNMEKRSRCGIWGLIFATIGAVLLAVPVVILFSLGAILNVGLIAIPCLALALSAILLEAMFVFKAGCHCCVKRYATFIAAASAILFALASAVVGTLVLPGIFSSIFVYIGAAALFAVLFGLVFQVDCLSK